MAVSGRKTEEGLSSSVYLASEEDYDLFCEPCNKDDQILPAYGYCTDCKEHLCESCYKHHRRNTLSRHHKLLDKDNRPQSQQLSSASAPANQSYDLTTPCPKHKKELIKFYCHDHKALICNICVTLEHTVTACKINYIPDISEQAVDGENYEHTLEKINILTEKCKKVTDKMKKMAVKSERSVEDVLLDIDKYRKEINQKINEIEEQDKDTAKTVREENNKKLKTNAKACDMVTKSLQASADTIKHLNSSKQADKLFMELKTAEQLIKDQEKRITDMKTPGNLDVKIYKFEPNQDISSFLEKKMSFGTLSFNTLAHSSPVDSSPPSKQLSSQSEATSHRTQTTDHKSLITAESRQPIHMGEIPIKSKQDDERCFIMGMVLLSPGRLVITDYYNHAVKMFDTNKKSLVCQLQLSSEPYGVSLVSSNELVVTQPNSESIQFISVSSNKLTQTKHLSVKGYCTGISCYKEKLVVSFLQPGKLHILDMKGRIQTEVKNTASGERIFDWPNFVTTSSKAIYVSDVETNTVFRLDWQGQVTGQYKGISLPSGICVRDDDSLYTCDVAGNIQQISSNFKEGKVVLKDLTRPFSVCYCSTESKLYISSRTTKDDKHDNFLQVYKV